VKGYEETSQAWRRRSGLRRVYPNWKMAGRVFEGLGRLPSLVKLSMVCHEFDEGQCESEIPVLRVRDETPMDEYWAVVKLLGVVERKRVGEKGKVLPEIDYVDVRRVGPVTAAGNKRGAKVCREEDERALQAWRVSWTDDLLRG
jgi:hypothetical protein